MVKNLEAERPWIEVRDPETGRVAARFAGDELRALVQDGRLSLGLLLSTRPERNHETIRRLLLLECQRQCRLRCGLSCLAGDCDLNPRSIDAANAPVDPDQPSGWPLVRGGD
ncbi:MAG: hypothetical protein ACOC00_06045 [Halothiobacillaceae bacterium]